MKVRLSLVIASLAGSVGCGELASPVGTESESDTDWSSACDIDEERHAYELDTGESYEMLGWEECWAYCEAVGTSSLDLAECWWSQDESGAVYAECWFGQLCEGRPPEGLQSDGSTADVGLGGWWARQAHMEAASVVAFARLAVGLERLGAPTALVERVRIAAADERRHAQATAELAAACGVRSRAPQVPGHRVQTLEEMALENAVAGCVNETFSAVLAAVQAAQAAGGAAPVLRRIAEEEARHAELAWDLHAWFSTQLDPRARARVHAALTAALDALPEHAPQQVPAGLEAAGLPAGEAVAGLARRTAQVLRLRAA